MKKLVLAVLVMTVVGGVAFYAAQHTQPAEAANADVPAGETPPAAAQPAALVSNSLAEAALKKAAEENKHLFLFLYGRDDEETSNARRKVEDAVRELGDIASAAFVSKDGAAEKEFVEEYGLGRAPMPIVLAFAPNGAVTGAFFGERLEDPQLEEGLVAGAEQQVLKTLQDGNLVLVCVQNGATKSNEAAMKGVNDFKADARFADFTEVIMLDPAAEDEKKFLAKLDIDPEVSEATTLFLAPPGALVAKVTGATDKDALFSALMAASAGGCGPSGCPL